MSTGELSVTGACVANAPAFCATPADAAPLRAVLGARGLRDMRKLGA